MIAVPECWCDSVLFSRQKRQRFLPHSSQYTSARCNWHVAHATVTAWAKWFNLLTFDSIMFLSTLRKVSLSSRCLTFCKIVCSRVDTRRMLDFWALFKLKKSTSEACFCFKCLMSSYLGFYECSDWITSERRLFSLCKTLYLSFFCSWKSRSSSFF